MHDISKLSSPSPGADRPLTGSNIDDAKETVSPTSGGGVAKLDAARERELPVVVVRRPARPGTDTVAEVAAAVGWALAHDG